MASLRPGAFFKAALHIPIGLGLLLMLAAGTALTKAAHKGFRKLR